MTSTSRPRSRILIVDDQPDFLRLVEAYLSTAPDEFQPVRYDPIEKGMPAEDFPWKDYDLLLIDYFLRDNTAFDWIEAYVDKPGFPPVIVITGDGDEKLATNAIRLGAFDYINKAHINAELLISFVRNAIAETAAKRADADDSPVEDQPNPEEARKLDTPHDIYDTNTGIKPSWPFSIHDVVNGKARVGDYAINNYVGSGGMSTVFKAVHPDHKDPVILKLLSGEITQDKRTKERFALEYALSRKINHPNVIEVYDQGFTEDYAYIAMEYLQHGDLVKRIRQGLSPELAITFATQIASALHELHQHGIIHRDIKPENILFREKNMPVLADFGVAKEMIRQHSDLTLTRTGMMVGTLAYASPEQIQGQPLDTRCDQYNLGLLLYEMLAGQKAYVGKTPVKIAVQHTSSPTPRLPTQYLEFQPLLNRLMEKNPKDRFDSIDDALEELLSLRLSQALIG